MEQNVRSASADEADESDAQPRTDRARKTHDEVRTHVNRRDERCEVRKENEGLALCNGDDCSTMEHLYSIIIIIMMTMWG